MLQFDRSATLDREQPLLDMGLDSLLAMELKNALMDGGVDIAVARVMTGPSIDQITQMVVTVLEEAPPPTAVAPEARSESVNAWVDRRVAGAVDSEAAPFNPVATHALAFMVGLVAAVGLYIGTAALVGFEQDMSGATAEVTTHKEVGKLADDDEPAPAAEPEPEPKAKTKTKGKGRKGKAKAEE